MEARVGLKEEEEEGVVWKTGPAACCQRASLQFGQLETHSQVVSVAECLFNGHLAISDALKTSHRLILKHS